MINSHFAKIRKKLIPFILIAGMISLSGCGTGKTESPSNTETKESVETNEGATEVSVVEDTEEVTTENIVETDEKDMTDVPILSECVEQTMGCRIGAAATGDEFNDEKVWEIITTHFNALTLGNELKPDSLFGYSNTTCPGVTTEEFNGEELEVPVINYRNPERALDKVLAWNEANPDKQIKVRGHVLVWHAQTPEWFFHEGYDKNEPYVDKETMNKRLEWYIKTVLTHFTGPDSKYKDLFYGWDVVNEAVSDGNGYRTDTENPSEPLSNSTHNNNSSWWHVYESEEYIINAFTYANKYAPQELELYYNDYNECNAVKRGNIIKLLEAVKAAEGEPGSGTRITAMGMQGHYGMDDPNMSNVQASIEAYGEVVGNVQITEFDIKASSDYDGSDEMKETEYEKQRKRYNTLYYAIKAAAANEEVNVTGITFWGTVDHYSWLQSTSGVGGGNTSKLPQCPLLFDENYEPKPCFWVFAQQD